VFDATRSVHAIFDYLQKWLPEEPAALKRLDDITDSEEDLDSFGSVEQRPISSAPVSGVEVTRQQPPIQKTRAAS
jgi:hypothetical protein